MNLAFPSSRNSFHAGWLLLLVPPLVSFTVVWWNDNPPVFNTIVVRLFLAIAVVLPLIWLRSGQVTGRTQRLLKELRTLMPGCLIATLVPALIALHDERGATEWAVWTYGFGCLLMGASAFGSEFEQRTMAGLLGQPLTRATLFLEKLGTLGLLLVFAALNLALSLAANLEFRFDLEHTTALLLIPAFAFCSGPLFSLESRSTLAGLIFTVTVPPGLAIGTTLAVQFVYRFNHPGETPPDAWAAWLFGTGTTVYLLATLLLGWRAFQRLEVRDGGAGGRTGTGLHPLSLPVDSLVGRLLPATGGTARLVRKELRLHVVPWLVAGLMIGLWLLWLALRHFTPDDELRATLNQVSAITVFAGLLGTLILLGAGAACVAEERELGTLEWQLTQPASSNRQWLVKLAVTGLVGLILGVVLPAALVFTGFERGALAGEFSNVNPLAWLAYAAALVAAFAASIYASSFSRNTMKATAATVGTLVWLWAAIGLPALAIIAALETSMDTAREQWESVRNITPPAWSPSQGTMEIIGALGLLGLAVLTISSLLLLGGRNFRRLVVPANTIVRQAIGISAALALFTFALGAIIIRLTLLQLQEQWVEGQRAERAQAVLLLGSLEQQGLLNDEIYRRYGVTTNSSPETLADAILASDGANGVHQLREKLNPPPPPVRGQLMMNPVLVRRYGLIPRQVAGPTGGAPTAQTNPPTFQMDPAMMKRYGLQPPAPQP
jgi:ABC-type transport system involved in multi-copper enzyme maturation permease subunit